MRSWQGTVAAIVAGTIVVDSFMVFADTGPDVMLIAGLCVLVGVGLWFMSELLSAPVEAADDAFRSTPTLHATDRRVMRLRSGLVYGRRDDTSLERLRASLVELVDDQLRSAHQVDRAVDPEAARAVLGDELFAFVDDPRTAHDLAAPQKLDRILTRIEQVCCRRTHDTARAPRSVASGA